VPTEKEKQLPWAIIKKRKGKKGKECTFYLHDKNVKGRNISGRRDSNHTSGLTKRKVKGEKGLGGKDTSRKKGKRNGEKLSSLA